MNPHQHDSTAPAWSPATDTMDTQKMQSSTYTGLNDPIINDMIQGQHREPWTALAQHQEPRSPQNPFWLLYRDTRVLSDDGTAPESAPGDARFRYDDMASITGAGHEAVGAPQMQQMFGGFQISNPGPHMPSMHDGAADAASTYSAATAGTGTGYRGGAHACTVCHKVFSSQSGLKKHTQAHDRPHRCNYAGCSKAEDGFGTPNDLTRHKSSVHKEAEIGYKCTQGDCPAASKPRVWTRKDNFRTHMSKVHKLNISSEEADTAYACMLDRRSEVAPSEDLTDTQPTGANSQVADSTLMDVDQPQYQSQQAMSTVMSDPGYFYPLDTSSNPASQHISFRGLTETAGMSFCTESVHSVQVHQPPSFGSQSFMPQPIPIHTAGIFAPTTVSNSSHQIAAQQGPPSQDVSVADNIKAFHSPKPSSVFSSSAPRENLTVASSQQVDAFNHDSLVNEGWTTSQLVDCLKTFPAELLQQALKLKQTSELPNEVEDNLGPKYQCSHCVKVCNRACELKKHMKRHERPYGCTFKDCGKSFGSKNDWKRHESGQHESVEAWACDEDGCTAICADRPTFFSHLMEAHDMIHDEDLQSRAQSCRVGRQCDAKFWCGFCRRVIEIDDVMVLEDTSNGTHQSRRFDHVDGHLFGKGGLEKRDKSQWRFLEDEVRGDTCQRTEQMSATASVWSATTSNEPSYKRKGSEHADSRPRKRADGQWATFTR